MTTAQWIVKVNEEDRPAPDLRTLQSWAREGRITRDSLVYHPVLARWGYVREFPEVNDHVQASPEKQQRSAARTSLLLAIVCILFAFMLGAMGIAPGVGALLGAAAFLFLIFAGVLYVLRR